MYGTQIHEWTGIQLGFSLCILLIAVLAVWLEFVVVNRKKLRTRFETIQKKHDRAVSSLLSAGFKDLGGQEWKPPINERNGQLLREKFALEHENTRLKSKMEKLDAKVKSHEWKDRARLRQERNELITLVRACYERANAHKSKQDTGRVRNGADACRWIEENARCMVETYGKFGPITEPPVKLEMRDIKIGPRDIISGESVPITFKDVLRG
jgi:hypothetical protein